MSPFLIYALVDPGTSEIRYIGKSSTGLKRPREHANPAVLGRDHGYKVNWIRGLLADGLNYEIKVLEELPSSDVLSDAEIRWIAYGRSEGWPLTNLTDGGEGTNGWTHSQETCERISAKMKCRMFSDETRQKMSVSQRLRPPPSAESIAKTAAFNRGRKKSPESIEKTANGNRGQKRSDEVRAKIRASILGRHASPETRAKMSAAMKGRRPGTAGKPVSEATRAKLRAAHLGMKRSPETCARIAAAKRGKPRPDVAARMQTPEARAQLERLHEARRASIQAKRDAAAPQENILSTPEIMDKVDSTT